MSQHVFISYSRADTDYVEQFAGELEHRGFEIWFDSKIDFGDRWWPTIEDRIKSCGAMIVVMSLDSNESDWVRREILFAQHLKKPIYPCLLSGDVFSMLIDRHYIDVSGGQLPQEQFYNHLPITPEYRSSDSTMSYEEESESGLLGNESVDDESEQWIGQVVDYYGQIQVAAIVLGGKLQVGDEICIRGISFFQTVGSMEINNRQVRKSRPGDSVGIQVNEQPLPGSLVYRVQDGEIGEIIGSVTHYFEEIGVAAVDLIENLRTKETIYFEELSYVTQKVRSMEIEHQQVRVARTGDFVGIKVNSPVCIGDDVYRL